MKGRHFLQKGSGTVYLYCVRLKITTTFPEETVHKKINLTLCSTSHNSNGNISGIYHTTAQSHSDPSLYHWNESVCRCHWDFLFLTLSCTEGLQIQRIFTSRVNTTRAGNVMAYSHCTGTGPAQLETMGPGSCPYLGPVWTFLYNILGCIDPGPMSCGCLGPIPARCE